MVKVRARKETGLLFFDFQFDGQRCREQTLLKESPANRARLQKIADQISAEILIGTFDYTNHFPTSKRAAKFANKIQNERKGIIPFASASGKQHSTALPMFSDFVQAWQEDNEIRWRNSTRATNKSNIDRHLLPAFGRQRLDDITRKDILAFRAELASKPNRSRNGTLHPKTVNHVMILLGAILAEAELQFGLSSPCRNIKKLNVPKSDILPFTMKEVQLILDNVRPDYHCYLTVRCFTGMRTGEVHGLKWKHIDLDHKVILIRETYARGRTEYTKTDGSQREIHMSDPVFEALLCRKQSLINPPNKESYVFCTANGKPIDTKNVTERVWYPLLCHLELEKRRPYHMRHTAATLWLAAGESPEWIARQMGHTTTEMLFKVYSRYVPNLTRQDGSAFDRLLAKEFGQALPIDSAGQEPDNRTANTPSPHSAD